MKTTCALREEGSLGRVTKCHIFKRYAFNEHMMTFIFEMSLPAFPACRLIDKWSSFKRLFKEFKAGDMMGCICCLLAAET